MSLIAWLPLSLLLHEEPVPPQSLREYQRIAKNAKRFCEEEWQVKALKETEPVVKRFQKSKKQAEQIAAMKKLWEIAQQFTDTQKRDISMNALYAMAILCESGDRAKGLLPDYLEYLRDQNRGKYRQVVWPGERGKESVITIYDAFGSIGEDSLFYLIDYLIDPDGDAKTTQARKKELRLKRESACVCKTIDHILNQELFVFYSAFRGGTLASDWIAYWMFSFSEADGKRFLHRTIRNLLWAKNPLVTFYSLRLSWTVESTRVETILILIYRLPELFIQTTLKRLNTISLRLKS